MQVIKRLREGQFIFLDDEDDHFIQMVDGIIFEHTKNGWMANQSFFLNTELFFEEENRQEEANVCDIGKLCLFWDYGTDDDAKPDEIHLLRDIRVNDEGREEFWCDGCGENGFYHARRCTPREVEKISGYKIKESK